MIRFPDDESRPNKAVNPSGGSGGFTSHRFSAAAGHGRRTLIPCLANNLGEVVAIPSCQATSHGNTRFVVLLLEEAVGEAFQPGNVVCGMAITEPTIILSKVTSRHQCKVLSMPQ